jgi:hypothetical protein
MITSHFDNRVLYFQVAFLFTGSLFGELVLY